MSSSMIYYKLYNKPCQLAAKTSDLVPVKFFSPKNTLQNKWNILTHQVVSTTPAHFKSEAKGEMYLVYHNLLQ